jgi:hypothetical protein
LAGKHPVRDLADRNGVGNATLTNVDDFLGYDLANRIVAVDDVQLPERVMVGRFEVASINGDG